ncbi:MAG: hypothetical protein JWM12_3202, partial [Ilumatobacteraceae bacterium]|nr:hypothetical protein [Ilumatobacteraceae bacterium]
MPTNHTRSVPSCVVLAEHAGADDILTADALALVAVMQRTHDHARRLLLA